jgi:multidrug efflux pump subunit AcrA (membrane-fusion protein)
MARKAFCEMTSFLQHLLTRNNLRSASRWLALSLVLALILGVGYWTYSRYSIPRVLLTEVVEGPVVQAFYATGTLVPYREFPVKSNVEGIVVEVLVDKGEAVKKGQKLAQVYVEEFLLKQQQAVADLELKQAQAGVKSPALLEFDVRIASLESQLEIAKREFNRLSQIRDTGGRTLSELDKAEEAVKTLTHARDALRSAKDTKRLELDRDVKVAKAALELAEWNVEEQTITSPIDGVVLDWPVAKGTRTRVNDLLMNVANVGFDALVLRTNVDEEDITRVKPLQTVKVSLYAYEHRVFAGRVQKIYPKADPARRTFEVDVEVLSPDPAFAPGMTSELAFVVEEKEKALVVPSQAVQQGKVWTVKDNRLQAVEVETGLKSILRTEIVSGLSLQDRVVITPVAKFSPGTEVRTTEIDPDVAAGLNEPKKDSSGFSKF